MADNVEPTSFSLVVSVPDEGRISDTVRADREAVLEAYRAMAAGDNDALMKMLDPNVTFHQAPGLPYGGEAEGVDDLLKLVGTMFGTWSKLHVDVMDVAVGTDVVIAYLMLDGISRATGSRYVGPTCELMRLRDSKIVEWRLMYWDTYGVRKACGLA